MLVERFGRLQVVAERLFDDHPPPVVVILLQQSSGRELFDNGPEETRSRRHIKEEILMGGVILIDLGQAIFDLRVKLIIVEIAGEVIEAAHEAFPGGVVDAIAAVLFHIFQDLLAEIFVRHLLAGHAQHRELLREQVRPRQVVQRGNQQARRQIAGGAEDHHHARISLFTDARCGHRGLFRQLSHDHILKFSR